MSKTRLQLLAVVLLLILFGFIWINTRSISPTPSGPGASPVTPLPKADLPSPEAPAATPAPAPSQAPPNPGRDPFELPAHLLAQLQERARQLELAKQQAAQTQRPVQPGTPKVGLGPEELELQGIFWGAAKPQVIIGRKIFSVGDEVDGAKIVAISQEGVTLSANGREVLVRPREPSRRKDEAK